MANWQEDEGPSVHYRSKFDTIPCAPMFTGKGDNGEPVRVSANGRAAFAFPGGTAEIRKPTREELVTSAKQWATAVRECFADHFETERTMQANRAMRSGLDRLDAVLAELAAL